MKNRLDVYRKNTFPLIDYYQKKGKLVTVKGDEGSIEDIFKKIEGIVKN